MVNKRNKKWVPLQNKFISLLAQNKIIMIDEFCFQKLEMPQNDGFGDSIKQTQTQLWKLLGNKQRKPFCVSSQTDEKT